MRGFQTFSQCAMFFYIGISLYDLDMGNSAIKESNDPITRAESIPLLNPTYCYELREVINSGSGPVGKVRCQVRRSVRVVSLFGFVRKCSVGTLVIVMPFFQFAGDGE